MCDKVKDKDKWPIIYKYVIFVNVLYSTIRTFYLSSLHFILFLTMGKITKKKLLKKKNVTTQKKRNFEVFVKLTRLSKEEYGFYKNPNGNIVKNFGIKISDEKMSIGGEKHRSEKEISNSTLNKQKSGQIGIHFNHPLQKEMASAKINRNCAKKSTTSKRVQFSGTISELETTQNTTLSKCVVKTLTSLINDSWKKMKMDFTATNTTICVGDLVMAKMKSYSAWPACIESFAKNRKRTNVHFFGSNNKGAVDVSEIVPFSQCHDVIRLLLLRKVTDFHKAIHEIEAVLNIPFERSLLKELEALN